MFITDVFKPTDVMVVIEVRSKTKRIIYTRWNGKYKNYGKTAANLNIPIFDQTVQTIQIERYSWKAALKYIPNCVLNVCILTLRYLICNRHITTWSAITFNCGTINYQSNITMSVVVQGNQIMTNQYRRYCQMILQRMNGQPLITE